jgi:hypothetical protein
MEEVSKPEPNCPSIGTPGWHLQIALDWADLQPGLGTPPDLPAFRFRLQDSASRVAILLRQRAQDQHRHVRRVLRLDHIYRPV